jgi:hypothetical protein
MMHLRIGLSFLIILSVPAWASRDALQLDLEKRSLQYFIENHHPQTGLVLDRVANALPRPASNNVASIAATGYGLVVISNAAKRGLVDKQYAYDYALRTLTFVRDHVERFHGFMEHWVDWSTGKGRWESDFSTIDTALFVAGALYAGQIFPGSEVSRIADRLYADMDFYVMMTDGGVETGRRTLSLTYSRDVGYSLWQWSIYAENMILYVMGLGSPTSALPSESWAAFDRGWGDIGEATPLIGYDMPLFIHQYSMSFIDFRNFDDGHPNYFVNSQRATEYNRRLALSERYKTYQEGFWGLSAGDAPNTLHYGVYGPGKHTSTACIGCALGSAMFAPDLVMNDVAKWLSGPYADKIIGRYGIVDGIDLEHDWVSEDFLAITVGTAYMSLVNLRGSESIWADFMNIPGIQQGLARAKTVPPRYWHPPLKH